jgi:hypothetical protein
VDWDCDSGQYSPRSLRRSAGAQVAGAKPRTPTAYRQERHVDTPGQVRHGREQLGVAGKVDSDRSRDEDAKGIF